MKSARTTNADTPSNALNSNNLSVQRERLLKALLSAPVSTIQARNELNILAPAPRIFELRHGQGKNIIRNWIIATTPEGYKHRVAEYVLLSGKWEGAFNE